MYERIRVIVNPSAGGNGPDFDILNRVSARLGGEWEIRTTQGSGDALRYAQEAVNGGINAVVAYGGDGTVSEVASGLVGTQIPLGILPNGTGNVISIELGIPQALSPACELIQSDLQELCTIDVGQMDNHYFLLRAGTGADACLIENATDEMKKKLGNLAYAIAGFQALTDAQIVEYSLTLDGQIIETEGVSCIIANSGKIGHPNLSLSPAIDVSDGLLDILIVRSGELGALLTMAADVVLQRKTTDLLQHWQARTIKLSANAPQPIHIDGSIIGQLPIVVKIIPQALRVIVPGQN